MKSAAETDGMDKNVNGWNDPLGPSDDVPLLSRPKILVARGTVLVLVPTANSISGYINGSVDLSSGINVLVHNVTRDLGLHVCRDRQSVSDDPKSLEPIGLGLRWYPENCGRTGINLKVQKLLAHLQSAQAYERDFTRGVLQFPIKRSFRALQVLSTSARETRDDINVGLHGIIDYQRHRLLELSKRRNSALAMLETTKLILNSLPFSYVKDLKSDAVAGLTPEIWSSERKQLWWEGLFTFLLHEASEFQLLCVEDSVVPPCFGIVSVNIVEHSVVHLMRQLKYYLERTHAHVWVSLTSKRCNEFVMSVFVLRH
ncbi:hypothetical protein J6590_011648 [Homalodisca vitripennis]|nr:hypothetical protein J6590_011648 [Homalodisca vitripennis]